MTRTVGPASSPRRASVSRARYSFGRVLGYERVPACGLVPAFGRVLALVALTAIGFGGAFAQDLTPEAALERLLTAEVVEEGWFTPQFLAEVPLSQLSPLITQLTSQLGSFQHVRSSGNRYEVVFERGVLPAELTVDSEGRISGLWLHPPVPAAANLEEAIDGFAELPGEVSVLVMAGGEALAAHDAHLPLAVGSSFKLAVVAELLDQIEAGAHSWDDVVEHGPRGRAENDDLLTRWLEGDDDSRNAVLEEAAQRELPDPAAFPTTPTALEVEWHFTTRELCDLIAEVEDLPLMTINPGVAIPEEWQRVAYKGGSEPAVLNLTTWLESDSGSEYCVSATWNRQDAALDETQFAGLYAALLQTLE